MRGNKIDSNQGEIVAALRKIGCSVTSLADVGKGCPDLLVGLAGKNYLIEVKDGQKPPSAQKLTPDQEIWHKVWQGQVKVVNNVNDALDLVTIEIV